MELVVYLWLITAAVNALAIIFIRRYDGINPT
jgi:hypothetical protein